MKIHYLTILVVQLAAASLCAADLIPLAGEWRFEIDKADASAYARELSGKITLPGTMDDAGLGPKNNKPPTLAGPYRLYDYAGPAWYQRDIEIPAAWAGKRVTLFLERCRWVTTVWLDDRKIGSQDSLIAPHVYDFGAGVPPGKHRLTICVDNTVKFDLGRFVSALFGGTWGNMNGIVGRIELNATPPVWLDDVQVYPNVAKKSALVKVRIGNATGRAGSGSVQCSVSSVQSGGELGRKEQAISAPAEWSPGGGAVELSMDLGPAARLWDEFEPNLQELTVKLGDHERTVRFGMREFASKGSQFTLNGRPIFLRGTLECSVWPLTGYPPTDVASWQRIYRIIKSYGLNHMRFHSWCPPEAAFAAADIEGIILQAEAPRANVGVGSYGPAEAFTEAELKRIVDAYGNHPSFCLMTLGNEFGGKEDLIAGWVEMLIRRDPRRLYSSASWASPIRNRQFTVTGDGRGVRGPATAEDNHAHVGAGGPPSVGHEVGQWMYFPDFNEIRKWTGVMALRSFEWIRDDLAKKHLLDLAPQYVQASGKFATLLYKEEIELFLRTAGYGGFQLLDLHDYPTQGTALIGPLDAFWESKGFITPDGFRRFCGPTVPLLRMKKRTYSASEPFEATVDVAHYGAADLGNVQPVWTIADGQGREVASGKLSLLNVPTGVLTPLGAISASLAKAGAPCKLTVTVALKDKPFSNDWEIWVYPQAAAPAPPEGVATSSNWGQAKKALAAGKKVIFYAYGSGTEASMTGRFLPVFWSPVWFSSQKPNTMGLLCDPKHPLFAGFPTESYSNWQWYNLMQRSRMFILNGTPADYRPVVQVMDNFSRNHKLGVVFEARVGEGRLLVCGFDLPRMADDPAARQLLASLHTYVGSDAFRPSRSLDAATLDGLFGAMAVLDLVEHGATVRGDSQEQGNEASRAIDADPSTMWHTSWSKDAPAFPHELVVQLRKPARLTGITCLPRQDDHRNGWIKEYAVYGSQDGTAWGEPLAKGVFEKNESLKMVKFSAPVTLRFVRLVAVSGFDNAPYASLAELNLIGEE